MKVLSKYFTNEFLKLFTLCLVLFLTLFLIIDFIQKIDNLVEAKASFETSFLYFLYKVPYIVLQMTPVATLISVIIMFALMKKNREILALKASGINVFKVSQTVLILSAGISIASFIFSESVVPYTSSKSNEIWNIEVEKQDPAGFYGGGHIWYKSSDAIYWIRHFDSINRIMAKPVFYFFNDSFSLIKRVDGTKGLWEGDVWKIEDGIIQELNSDGGYDLKKFDSLYLDIPETPETFIRGEKRPEDMSLLQLKKFAEEVSSEGYDNTRYIVDMNIKLAFPLVSLIMTVIGIPLALGFKGESIPLAVSIGVGICFFYMLFLGFARSLGLSGIFPPVLSAWSANLVFVLFGIYLILHQDR